MFRTLPTHRLLAVLAAFGVALVVGVAIAVGATSGGSTPPAKALPNAIQDALSAQPPAGVTARITFTNNLLPTGGALTGQVGSPLASGASGRLWLTNDGRGRLELQSNSGDAQIVWNDKLVTIYDASSNTAYQVALPANTQTSTTSADTPQTLAQIGDALTKAAQYWNVGNATPSNIAGQPAYDVRVTPKTSAGLVGAAELAWDAANGVPLKLAVYARGDATPVLELAAIDVSFGSVASSDVDVTPPSGAKVVDIPTSAGNGSQPSTEVTGLAAVQAALPFHVSAPDSLGGLTRTDVRLVGNGDSKGALVVYGEGLGAVAVVEHAADAQAKSLLASLPAVTIHGAVGHELATPLGSLVTWDSGGVSFVLAGSVTSATAEADAASVQ